MFKDKIKELREQKGLSQYQLADQIFVSRSTIAKWENGLGMPGKASLESLCEFFNVSKEELLREDDPEIIINNIQKKSKKILTVLIILLIPLILYCLAFTAFIINEAYLDTMRPVDGKYYSEKYLKKFDLGGLDMIDGQQYQLFGTTFSASIESYDVFYDYVNYVYNKLQYSTTISYLSIDKKIYKPRNKYADLYLIPSSNLYDHIDKVDITGRPIEYEFYFFNENTKRDDEEYINCNYLKMSCKDFGDNGLNFSMSLFKSEGDEDSYQKAYLVNDYFIINKVALTNENIETYLLSKTDDHNTIISFHPHGTYITSGLNVSPIPPFHLFVKAKFSLYHDSRLIDEIEQTGLFTYGDYLRVTYEDFGYDVTEFAKYEVKVTYEVLDYSYYYEIQKIN